MRYFQKVWIKVGCRDPLLININTHGCACMCTLSPEKDFHLICHFSNTSLSFLKDFLKTWSYCFMKLGCKVQLTNTVLYLVTYSAKRRSKTKWKNFFFLISHSKSIFTLHNRTMNCLEWTLLNPLSEKVLELHWYSGFKKKKKKRKSKLKSKYLLNFKEDKNLNLNIYLANKIFNLALKPFFQL